MNTAVCYFSENNNYDEKRQIEHICLEEDNVSLFKEDGDFSPEKADSLIESAIKNGSDRLIFVAKEDLVESLTRLIPQEYGEFFEDIQIVEENFIRFKENDNAALQATSAIINNNQQSQQEQPNKQQDKKLGDKVVFICNAASPHIKSLTQFIKDCQVYESQINNGVLNKMQLNGAPSMEKWFCNVDSAGLCASSIHKLYENHPSEAVKSAYTNSNMSKEGFDANIESLIAMAQTSETVKNGFKYIFIVPKDINIQSSNQNIIQILPLQYNYENPNNSKILNYIMEISKAIDTKNADLKKRSNLPSDEKEYAKEFQKNEANVKFIYTYVKAFTWWTKNKDKRIKTSTAESEFEKALKEFMLADFNNALNDLKSGTYGSGTAFLANSLEKMYKGIKKDLSTKQDEEDKKEYKTNNEEKANKKIFEYVHYEELCKLLDLQI